MTKRIAFTFGTNESAEYPRLVNNQLESLLGSNKMKAMFLLLTLAGSCILPSRLSRSSPHRTALVLRPRRPAGEQSPRKSDSTGRALTHLSSAQQPGSSPAGVLLNLDSQSRDQFLRHSRRPVPTLAGATISRGLPRKRKTDASGSNPGRSARPVSRLTSSRIFGPSLPAACAWSRMCDPLPLPDNPAGPAGRVEQLALLGDGEFVFLCGWCRNLLRPPDTRGSPRFQHWAEGLCRRIRVCAYQGCSG